jgi:hypothetical protein
MLSVSKKLPAQRGSVFMFAAIPGIARAPQFRRSAPVPTSEIELAAFGFFALLIFGIVLAVIWNHFNERRPKVI